MFCVRLQTMGAVSRNHTPCSMLGWVRTTCSARGAEVYQRRKKKRPPPLPRRKHLFSHDRRSCGPENVSRRCRCCTCGLTPAEQQTSARAPRSAGRPGFRRIGFSAHGALWRLRTSLRGLLPPGVPDVLKCPVTVTVGNRQGRYPFSPPPLESGSLGSSGLQSQKKGSSRGPDCSAGRRTGTM